MIWLGIRRLEFFVWQCHAADGELAGALRKGLFEEEANQDLPATIRAYEEVIRRHDAQRQLAATAVFRLGECYRKLERPNEAVIQFQRLLQDFPDLTNLTTPAERNLAAMGIATAKLGETGERIHIPNAREIGLIKEQIDLAKQELAVNRRRFEGGQVPSDSVLFYEQAVARLNRDSRNRASAAGKRPCRRADLQSAVSRKDIAPSSTHLGHGIHSNALSGFPPGRLQVGDTADCKSALRQSH